MMNKGSTRTVVYINTQNKSLIVQHLNNQFISNKNQANVDKNVTRGWFDSPQQSGMKCHNVTLYQLVELFRSIDFLKMISCDLIDVIDSYCNNMAAAVSCVITFLPITNADSKKNNTHNANKDNTQPRQVQTNTKTIFEYFHQFTPNYRNIAPISTLSIIRRRRTSLAKVNDIIDPYLFVYQFKDYFQFIPTLVHLSLNHENKKTQSKYTAKIIKTPLKMYYNPAKDVFYKKMYQYFELIISNMMVQFEDILPVDSILDYKNGSNIDEAKTASGDYKNDNDDDNDTFQFIFKVIEYEMYQESDFYGNLWHFDGISKEHIKCIGIYYTYNSIDDKNGSDDYCGRLEFTFDKNIDPIMHTQRKRCDRVIFRNDKNKNVDKEFEKCGYNIDEMNIQFKSSYFAIHSNCNTSVVWNNEKIQHRMGFWQCMKHMKNKNDLKQKQRYLNSLKRRQESQDKNKNNDNIFGARQAVIVMMVDPKYRIKDYDENDQQLRQITFEQAKQRVSLIRKKRQGFINKGINCTPNAYLGRKQQDVNVAIRNDAEIECLRRMPYCSDCGVAGHVGSDAMGFPPKPYII